MTLFLDLPEKMIYIHTYLFYFIFLMSKSQDEVAHFQVFFCLFLTFHPCSVIFITPLLLSRLDIIWFKRCAHLLSAHCVSGTVFHFVRQTFGCYEPRDGSNVMRKKVEPECTKLSASAK